MARFNALQSEYSFFKGCLQLQDFINKCNSKLNSGEDRGTFNFETVRIKGVPDLTMCALGKRGPKHGVGVETAIYALNRCESTSGFRSGARVTLHEPSLAAS